MKRDPSYSPDVEIDHENKLVAARRITKGEIIAVPVHMFNKAADWKPPYGEMCRDPTMCWGKGYCPRDPTCGD